MGDKRPPSELSRIQPQGWLAEYTSELLNVLNVLGRLVALEPTQAQLLRASAMGNALTQSGSARHWQSSPKRFAGLIRRFFSSNALDTAGPYLVNGPIRIAGRVADHREDGRERGLEHTGGGAKPSQPPPRLWQTSTKSFTAVFSLIACSSCNW